MSNLVPLNDAAQQLVNGEDGTAVRDVMVGGVYVLRDGVLPGIDWPRIVMRARDAAERLKAANAESRVAAERLAPVISQFCVGLGRCAHDLPRIWAFPPDEFGVRPRRYRRSPEHVHDARHRVDTIAECPRPRPSAARIVTHPPPRHDVPPRSGLWPRLLLV